jgi:hypothetical protein
MLRPRAFLKAETFRFWIFDLSPAHRQIKRKQCNNATFGYDIYQPVSIAGWSTDNLDDSTCGQSDCHPPALDHIERKRGILQLESSAS